jgi:hypothetical protein
MLCLDIILEMGQSHKKYENVYIRLFACSMSNDVSCQIMFDSCFAHLIGMGIIIKHVIQNLIAALQDIDNIVLNID